MNITQDSFNKLYTLILTIFFMGVFVIAFVTGKQVDWQTLTVFIVPTLNHVASLFTSSSVVTTSIQAEASKEVAKTQATGGEATNGNGGTNGHS